MAMQTITTSNDLTLNIGDEISYGFNGDAYPCGKIVRITETRITSDQGNAFNKKKNGRFYYGGTWSLIKGAVSKQNPSF